MFDMNDDQRVQQIKLSIGAMNILIEVNKNII